MVVCSLTATNQRNESEGTMGHYLYDRERDYEDSDEYLTRPSAHEFFIAVVITTFVMVTIVGGFYIFWKG